MSTARPSKHEGEPCKPCSEGRPSGGQGELLPQEEAPQPVLVVLGMVGSATWLLGDRSAARATEAGCDEQVDCITYDGYGNIVGATDDDTSAERYAYVGRDVDRELVERFRRCPCQHLPQPRGRWLSAEPVGLCTPDPDWYPYPATERKEQDPEPPGAA